MDGAEINEVVKSLPDFGGIFDASKLDRLKVLDLPVMLIINIEDHWLGIRLEKNKLEIMDSLGEIKHFAKNKVLCRFICAHLLGKKLIVSPKLQSDNSQDCGKYVLSFLWFSALTGKSLTHFLKSFNSDYTENSKNITEIFETVRKIADSY